jgi:hypothetical protein
MDLSTLSTQFSTFADDDALLSLAAETSGDDPIYASRDCHSLLSSP